MELELYKCNKVKKKCIDADCHHSKPHEKSIREACIGTSCNKFVDIHIPEIDQAKQLILDTRCELIKK